MATKKDIEKAKKDIEYAESVIRTRANIGRVYRFLYNHNFGPFRENDQNRLLKAKQNLQKIVEDYSFSRGYN